VKLKEVKNLCSNSQEWTNLAEYSVEGCGLQRKFKGKHSIGVDEIPDYIFKKCREAIKNH
jgi:hypothetical protein